MPLLLTVVAKGDVAALTLAFYSRTGSATTRDYRVSAVGSRAPPAVWFISQMPSQGEIFEFSHEPIILKNLLNIRRMEKLHTFRATNVGASLGYFYPEVMLDANKTGTMRAGGNVGKEPPRFHGQTKRTFKFPLIGIACSQVGGEREHGAGGGV